MLCFHGLSWIIIVDIEAQIRKQGILFKPTEPSVSKQCHQQQSKPKKGLLLLCLGQPVPQFHCPLFMVQVPLLLVPLSKNKKAPWNKGQKMSKSDMQHLFIPREDYELFLAVALYFAGPKYVMAFWLTMVTSRRISETLRLHGEDVFLEGGTHHDSPHILFKKRPEEEQYPGAGKLRGKYVVARLAPDARATLEQVMNSNLERALLPALKPFEMSHPQVFQDKYPMAAGAFKWPNGSGYIFPAATKKKPRSHGWLGNQSHWL